MRIPRIHVGQTIAAQRRIVLGGTAARHLTRVLRLRPGAEVVIFDGGGGEYTGRLEQVQRNGAQIAVGQFCDVDRESTLQMTLVQGLSRGERMDQIVQKATELGVTTLVPLATDFSVVKLDADRAERRLTRWRGVAAHACEQCGRNRLPVIDPPETFDRWLDAANRDGLRLVLDPAAKDGWPDRQAVTQVTLLVGPEGGLSPRENEVAVAAGFIPVRAGPRILRTETAAVAAIAIAQHRWGDQ